jgi:hypothetical protein
MRDDAGPGLVERAREAAALNDWRQAFDLLMEADTDGLLAPPTYRCLARSPMRPASSR